MLTREQFKKIAGVLNVINGKNMLIDDVAQAEVWYQCLKDLDYEICQKAVMNLALRSRYGVKIADVRAAYAEIVTAQELPVEEAWAIVREAIRDSYYHGKERFEKFPEIVRRVVVDPMQLQEWGQLPSKDVDTVIQAYFRKSYEDALLRKKNDAVLGDIGTKAGAFLVAHEQIAIEKRRSTDEAD